MKTDFIACLRFASDFEMIKVVFDYFKIISNLSLVKETIFLYTWSNTS